MKFGTSGLRGVAEELERGGAARYAEAFLRYLMEKEIARRGDRVYLARDFRVSSAVIRDACANAILKAGLVPVDCGLRSTPALALHAMANQSAAMMITGSHIPAERNGIKFYTPEGEIAKEDEVAISRVAGGLKPIAEVTAFDPNMMVDDASAAASRYLERCKSILAPDALRAMRIGVYEHSCVTRDVMADVLEHYGAKVVRLGRSEAFLAVDTEALGAAVRQQFSHWSEEHSLDAIVSADGDGDRALVTDEHGEPLSGDLLGLVCARFLKVDVVVTPVTSNSGIRSEPGMDVVRTKVGSPFVIEAMKACDQERVIIGFEANGGVLLQSEANGPAGKISALPTRDCMLPILATLALAVEDAQPVWVLRQSWNLPIAIANRLRNVVPERMTAFISRLVVDTTFADQLISSIGVVRSTDLTDGVRFQLTTGEILHYRTSGNAPELRCYVEAASKERADSLLKEGLLCARTHCGGEI